MWRNIFIIIFLSHTCYSQVNEVPYCLDLTLGYHSEEGNITCLMNRQDSSKLCFNSKEQKATGFDKNGSLKYSGYYSDKRRSCCIYKDGEWKIYYFNSKLYAIGKYKDNLPYGKWTYFYENGLIMKVENYRIIDTQGEFKSILCKSFREYFESGTLKTKGFYKVEEGKDSIAIPSSTPPYSDEYVTYKSRSSFKTGKWKNFDLNGKLIKIEEY